MSLFFPLTVHPVSPHLCIFHACSQGQTEREKGRKIRVQIRLGKRYGGNCNERKDFEVRRRDRKVRGERRKCIGEGQGVRREKYQEGVVERREEEGTRWHY